jgi:Tfp pilus assembly protein PilE
LWQDKPFARGQAWIDILLMVNHQDEKILFDGGLVDVKRGSRITSVRKLCNRWGWSNTKVVKFLEILQDEKMLSYESNKKKTVITVVNYDLYQNETTLKRHRNDTETTLKHTNNNDNNDNNDNKETYSVFFTTYNNQNIISHKALTPKMKQAINRALKKDKQEDILEAIKRYGQAFADPGYQFCKYKMTLDKFLIQSNGYYDWLDEGQKWINYSDFKKRENGKNIKPAGDNFKTKFHLEKSRGDKYSAEELERIVLENSKRRLEER